MTRCDVPDLEPRSSLMTRSRTLLAPCALLVLAASASPPAVAARARQLRRQGRRPDIKRDTFDHWMKITAISSAGQTNPAGAKAAGARRARLQAVHRRQEEDGGQAGQGPARSRPTRSSRPQCQQQYDSLKTRSWGSCPRHLARPGGRKPEGQGRRQADVRSRSTTSRSSSSRRRRLREVPALVGPDQRRRALPAAHQLLAAEDHRQGHQGQGQGHRRPDRGLLQQEQVALLPARAPRPADRADQGPRPRPSRPRRRWRAASR